MRSLGLLLSLPHMLSLLSSVKLIEAKPLNHMPRGLEYLNPVIPAIRSPKPLHQDFDHGEGTTQLLSRSPDATKTNPAQQQSTSLNPAHRLRKRWGETNFVVCATEYEILNVMDPDPDSYHTFDHPEHRYQERFDYRDPDNPFREDQAEAWHTRCTNCDCDDDGNLQPNPVRPLIGAWAWCNGEHVVRACLAWYACGCVANIEPKRRPVGVNVDRADGVLEWIDRFHETSEQNNRGQRYDWLSPGEYEPVQPREDRRQYRMSKNKQLLAGNKEPFFVEGPGGLTWDFLSSPLLSYPGSANRFPIKRRNIEIDNPPAVEQEVESVSPSVQPSR
ncbi:hypothetical protein Dda_4323 [Drechslerella dactyloides]|uniref:Secreted protein n=1 Tax=Drechslerella dactyloides TaxID=74499 RepID=A0AAD6IXD6_DREDA|nr:hypothetical protein Dda_4323 [Drechslerella dactyloides]